MAADQSNFGTIFLNHIYLLSFLITGEYYFRIKKAAFLNCLLMPINRILEKHQQINAQQDIKNPVIDWPAEVRQKLDEGYK